jgi:hypothetical protein
MEIRPDETAMTGAWELVNEGMQEDEVLRRIHALVKDHLQRVAATPNGWDTLYRDPADGRYWELRYPYGKMHGNGPASLCVLDPASARAKYSLPPE